MKADRLIRNGWSVGGSASPFDLIKGGEAVTGV